MQQLLTVCKVLWGVESAGLGEDLQRKRSDLDRFIVYSKQQENDAVPPLDQSVKGCLTL